MIPIYGMIKNNMLRAGNRNNRLALIIFNIPQIRISAKH